MMWTCMVCGEERPDDRIDVYTERTYEPVQMAVNVRHCNDKGQCIAGATEHDMLGLVREA